MHPEIQRFLDSAGRTAGNCRLIVETADRRFDVPTGNMLVRLVDEQEDGSTQEIARWTGDLRKFAEYLNA